MARNSVINIRSVPKNYSYDQDKATDPLITVNAAIKHLSGMFDLSNIKLERRKDLVEGAYSYTSASDQFNCSGKGLTDAQAQASAAMEFAERYSWLHFDYAHHDGFRVATYNEIRKGDTLTVNDDYFLSNITGINDPEKLLREIKEIPLKWIKAYSLNRKCKFYYPVNWHNMTMGSNGLASGNTIEEAIIQALCEVIERECLYRLFVCDEPGKEIDPGGLKNRMIRDTLTSAKRQEVCFKILDISYDFIAPTVIVRGTSEKDIGRLSHVGVGQGTATDPEKTIIRSLAEYFESFSLTKNKEMEMQGKMKKDLMQYAKHFKPQHYGFLALYHPYMLDRSAGLLAANEMKNCSKPDFKDEIQTVVDDLAKKGYEVAVINKTNEKLKIPVVRLFLPGMRNMINCDIDNVDFALAEVYFEANDHVRAQEHLDESLKRNIGISHLDRFMKVKKVFDKDYMLHFSRTMNIKKNAVDLIADLEGIAGRMEKEHH